MFEPEKEESGSTEGENGETGTGSMEEENREANGSSGAGNDTAGSHDTSTGGNAGDEVADIEAGGVHNHTEKNIVINQREATYIKSGYTGDMACSVCGRLKAAKKQGCF